MNAVTSIRSNNAVSFRLDHRLNFVANVPVKPPGSVRLPSQTSFRDPTSSPEKSSWLANGDRRVQAFLGSRNEIERTLIDLADRVGGVEVSVESCAGRLIR
jgi:hypothetical protein